MKHRKLGKNRGVWCGTVVSGLEFSHELVDRKSGEVVDRFYNLEIMTEITDKEGQVIDVSNLPVTLSVKKLVNIRPEVDNVEEKLMTGDIVFIKGSWRTYDNKENDATKLEQYAYVKVIELHNEYTVKVRNKFEFEGVLVKKLYEIARDGENNPFKDEEGRLVPALDEEGRMKYTVRKNKEGKIVNDYIVAINRPNGSDYVPCLSYKGLAKYISKEIEVGSEVQGSGYIRTRKYTDKYGRNRVAYEAVINRLEKVESDKEQLVENNEEE